MSFLWNDFLGFAINLKNSDSQDFLEARKRTVISRAYYAAFLIARDFAVDNENLTIDIYSENSHSKVMNHYRKSSKRYGVYACLYDLRFWRNNCDYDKSVTNLDSLMTNAIQKANKVISFFS